MFADFDGGQISRTDYFQSRDRDEGRAWLIVQGGCWHVLVPPHFNCRASHALARPVVDHGEWEGWRWRLEIGGQRLQLPRRQILGYRPMLPQPFTRTHRTLHLYASETARHGGQSLTPRLPAVSGSPQTCRLSQRPPNLRPLAFGSVEPGVQLHGTCRLLLIRESEEALKRRRLEGADY